MTTFINPPSQKWLDEEIELFPPVIRDNHYGNILVVDNLPIVNREKEPKLIRVITQIFSKFGTVKDCHMPFKDSPEDSKGFAFIEYTNENEATNAQSKLDGHQLDKNHVFKVNRFDDFQKYANIPEEFKSENTTAEYEEPEDLNSWLLDPYGCDQFVLRYADETEVMWMGVPGALPHSDMKQSKATEKFVSWSPRGTYLVCLHKLGVILLGGPTWKKIKRFRHPGVHLVDFSPCENFLVTQSILDKEDSVADPQALGVWDVKSGVRLRGFQTLPRKTGDEHAHVPYNPIINFFLWSHDDKYFSRLYEGTIQVYETPSMTLLQKKPIKLHGPTTDHSWSPADPILGAFVPERANIPARVVLLKFSEGKYNPIGQQALFSVLNCCMHWHPQGDFLAVKVDRKKKSKKQFTAFEFFRIREKDIPVENLDLEDNVMAFAWEPRGKKFAIIHGENQTTRPNVSVYSLDDTKVRKIVTLEKRAAVGLYWSPQGRYLLLCGRLQDGKLEFYDTQDCEELAKDKQHSMVTNVEWDPTGRYVTTYVSNWRAQNENGYKIWDFKGTEIINVNKEPFYQFLWRPRPPTMLTAEQEKNLTASMKDYRAKYRAEDRKKQEEREVNLQKQKDERRKVFRDYMSKKRKEWEADAAWRKEKFGIEPDREDNYYLVEEQVQEIISEQVVGE